VHRIAPVIALALAAAGPAPAVAAPARPAAPAVTAAYIRHVAPRTDPALARFLAQLLHREATSQGVPLPLALGILEAESGFDWRAVSRTGDVGLGQVHWPTWGPRLGLRPEELAHPALNIPVALGILGAAWRAQGGDAIGTAMAYSGRRGAAGLRYARQVLQASVRYARFRDRVLAHPPSGS